MIEKGKIALITTLFSPDQKRLQALAKSIHNLKKQTQKYNHYLIELVEKESKLPVSIKEQVIHKEVELKENQRNLWQKEALYNQVFNFIEDEDYLIFIDGDIGVEDENWLTKVVKKLEKKCVLQPYKNVVDTESSILNFSSIASYHHLKESDYPPHGAGTVWAFTREVFKEIEGFNSLYPEGSGDTAFLMEFLPRDSIAYSSYIERYEWFMNLLRSKKDHIYQLDYLDTDIIHYNHGMERYYTDRANYLNQLTHSPLEYFKIGDNGLLEWKESSLNILKEMNELIFNKLNSKFSNLSLSKIKNYIDKEELTLKEDNTHALDAKSTIMIEGKNWAFVEKHNNDFLIESLYPIKNDTFLFFFVDTNLEISIDFKQLNSQIDYQIFDESFSKLLEEKVNIDKHFKYQSEFHGTGLLKAYN